MKQTEVLVIGGGIVGTCMGLELLSRGHKVIIIDKGEAGYGCSYGNAGWMTPCFSMPLPQPGLFFKAFKWMLNPDSPFYIKPEINPRLFSWLMSFLGSMNYAKMERSIEVLTEISKYSLDFYKRLSLENPSFGFQQKGLLMVSAEKSGLEAAKLELELMQKNGVTGKYMGRDEILSFEPALKSLVQGGVYFDQEGHAEPLLTVKAVEQKFKQMGGEIHTSTEVYEIETEGSHISRLRTTRGEYSADTYILCAGSWSVGMAKSIGLNVPILGGKGYSMIVEDFQTPPQHPIMILERKIAVTPHANHVRLAGTLELVDQDFSITPRRVRAIYNGSREYLNMGEQTKVIELWRGLRPCTPDGVPMIGASRKFTNLFYNAGHQMLGLQSAAGAARVATDIMEGKPTITKTEPFDPARYE